MKRKLIVDDETPSGDVTSMASSDAERHNPESALPWLGYRRHDQNASIVFVGPRGTGTSSLAVIAGSIFGWKIIDCDHEFEKLAGSTKQQYRGKHGVECYRQRKLDIVQELLEANTKRCVFACGAIILRKKSSFFLKYAQDHPIVYVIRERKSIQNYLGLADDGRWEDAVEHMHFFFRQRSNYEFFNLDEAKEPRWQTTLTAFLQTKSQSPSQAPQVLRKTRAHVSILLRNMFGSTHRTKRYEDIPAVSAPRPELRQGSHVLYLELDDIKRNNEYLTSLDTGHDAVQLNITGTPHEWHTVLSQETLAWALAALRRQLDIPIVVNLATPPISSHSVPSNHPKTYGLLLHLILRLAPEYLTVDLRSEDQIIRQVVQAKGLTRVIGCLHNDQPLESLPDSESILSQYHRARRLGCELVSFSGLSRTLHDNIVCQQVSHSISKLGLATPAIFFNFGALGRLSQVLNPFMTPAIPDVQTQHSEQESMARLGLTSSRQLRMAWHMLHPLKRTQYYVFGAEVRQSLSTAMHNAGFVSCGLPFVYQAHESPNFSMVAVISSQTSFGGASISLPFKSQILALAAKQSPAVQMIGAANTLLPLPNISGSLDKGQNEPEDADLPDQLIAENTDWMGIYACIDKHCTPANHITKETSALVIGAGGMARAAIYALVKLGVENIFILNRTHDNAVKLKDHFEHTCGALEDSVHDASYSQTTYNPTFHVLQFCDEPWPDDVHLPSVIICAIPARATEDIPEYPPELRHDWLNNPTGGLVADVSAFVDIKCDGR